MASRTASNTNQPAQGVQAAIAPTHYVEWSAVIAGSVLACALSLVLAQFGNAVGLSATYYRGGVEITSTRLVMAGLWLVFMQLAASVTGGYLAGRMRAPWDKASYESEMRDGVHGLLVWALSTLVAATAAAGGAFLAAVAGPAGVDFTASIPQGLLQRHAIIMAFALSASSLVAAVAAWAMAVKGGDHRDRGADGSRFISFRKGRSKR